VCDEQKNDRLATSSGSGIQGGDDEAGRASAASPSLPPGKELVSLRIDRDVLAYFQEAGPGWQDRINAALKKVAGI
jgi:uncharacterized protein (DUF4415 family)